MTIKLMIVYALSTILLAVLLVLGKKLGETWRSSGKEEDEEEK